jgi:hypothetical protein
MLMVAARVTASRTRTAARLPAAVSGSLRASTSSSASRHTYSCAPTQPDPTLHPAWAISVHSRQRVYSRCSTVDDIAGTEHRSTPIQRAFKTVFNISLQQVQELPWYALEPHEWQTYAYEGAGSGVHLPDAGVLLPGHALYLLRGERQVLVVLHLHSSYLNPETSV